METHFPRKGSISSAIKTLIVSFIGHTPLLLLFEIRKKNLKPGTGSGGTVNENFPFVGMDNFIG